MLLLKTEVSQHLTLWHQALGKRWLFLIPEPFPGAAYDNVSLIFLATIVERVCNQLFKK
jgi:hypothetical protein